MTDFKKGDIVRASTKRKNGSTRELEGQVVDVTPTRLRIEWEHTSGGRNGFTWAVREAWVKKADARWLGHKKRRVSQDAGRSICGLLRDAALARNASDESEVGGG